MNILSTTEAIEHVSALLFRVVFSYYSPIVHINDVMQLRTSSWERSALRDAAMLPLGLDASHIPLLS